MTTCILPQGQGRKSKGNGLDRPVDPGGQMAEGGHVLHLGIYYVGRSSPLSRILRYRWRDKSFWLHIDQLLFHM